MGLITSGLQVYQEPHPQASCRPKRYDWDVFQRTDLKEFVVMASSAWELVMASRSHRYQAMV